MLSLSIENLRAKGWNGISCKHQSTAGTGIEHNPKTHYYSQGSVSFLTAPKHSFPHLTDDVLGRKGPAQHPFNKCSLHLPENQQQERARCGSVRSMDQLRSCVSREWRPAMMSRAWWQDVTCCVLRPRQPTHWKITTFSTNAFDTKKAMGALFAF